LGTIKHPSGSDAVTAQTEGGAHPRGTGTKNYRREETGADAGQKPAGGQGAGKHFRDDQAGPSDLDRNPGIGSSSGTFSTGESGIEERDETTGVTPRPT
jgi:hypothetical protein